MIERTKKLVEAVNPLRFRFASLRLEVCLFLGEGGKDMMRRHVRDREVG